MISKPVLKWNPKTREYKPYNYPDDWYISCYENDMDETIDCAGCGEAIRFGSGYTSKQIHTQMGFGYCVCEDCYNRERKEEREANK